MIIMTWDNAENGEITPMLTAYRDNGEMTQKTTTSRDNTESGEITPKVFIGIWRDNAEYCKITLAMFTRMPAR
jgi:hypothetical protein